MKSLVSYSKVDPDEMVFFTALTLTKLIVRLPEDVEAPNFPSTAYTADPALAVFPVKLLSSILIIKGRESEDNFSM